MIFPNAMSAVQNSRNPQAFRGIAADLPAAGALRQAAPTVPTVGTTDFHVSCPFTFIYTTYSIISQLPRSFFTTGKYGKFFWGFRFGRTGRMLRFLVISPVVALLPCSANTLRPMGRRVFLLMNIQLLPLSITGSTASRTGACPCAAWE